MLGTNLGTVERWKSDFRSLRKRRQRKTLVFLLRYSGPGGRRFKSFRLDQFFLPQFSRTFVAHCFCREDVRWKCSAASDEARDTAGKEAARIVVRADAPIFKDLHGPGGFGTFERNITRPLPSSEK